MPEILRGEIWFGCLDPTQGHEQSGVRPLLIISEDSFNRSGAGLVIVVPITTQQKRVRSHVPLTPPEGGVQRISYIKCEDVRSVSKERLTSRWGEVSDETLAAVEYRLRYLMRL